MKYLIIGNSAAGIGALEAIREVDQEGAVTIVSDEPYPAYGRVFITKVLLGCCELDGILSRPRGFYDRLGCHAVLGEVAAALVPAKKEVILASGRTIPYDRLLLATGASARMPKIPGAGLSGVACLRTIDDAREILRQTRDARRAVILGGGPVGLHAAEGLVHHGLEVTLIVASDHVLSTLASAEATAVIEREMVKHGVKILFEQSITSVHGNGRVQGVTLQDGRHIPCDMVVVGKGVVPNTALAQRAGIEIGVGIRVDSRQGTGEPGVYAAGDAAESYDAVRGGGRLNAMWPNAVFQGRVAGLNMAGRSVSGTGFVNVNTGAFFGIPIAVAGLSRLERPSCEELELVDSRRSGHIVVSQEVNGVRKLLGAVLIGDIRGAGVLHHLIRSGANVNPYLQDFMQRQFSYGVIVGSVRKLVC